MEWDFLANSTVDTLDVVPEAFRPVYQEDKANSNFIVNPDLKALADSFTNTAKKLKATNTTRTEDNKKDKERRLALEGVQAAIVELGIEIPDNVSLPEVIKSTFTTLSDSVKGGKEARVNVEAAKAEFQKQVKAITDTHTKEVSGLTATLEKHMIESAAAQELAKMGVVENGMELLMPMIRKTTKLQKQETGDYKVIVVDENNNIRVDQHAADMNIPSLITDLKAKFPMAFKSENKGGGGTNNAATKKPVQNAGKAATDGRSSVDKIAAGLDKGQHKL